MTKVRKVKHPHHNYTFRVVVGGEQVGGYRCKSLRRFLHEIRSTIFENKMFEWGVGTEVYLRVSYGTGRCLTGCTCASFNEGVYKDIDALRLALEAFIEF